MARGLKFGKRLKNPFHKRHPTSSSSSLSSSSISNGDRSTTSSLGVGLIIASQSTESGAGSLNSNARDHGPIDSDTCRRYRLNRKKKKQNVDGNQILGHSDGQSLSPSPSALPSVGGSRRRRRRSRGRDKGNTKKSELPKIVESRSCSPSDENVVGVPTTEKEPHKPLQQHHLPSSPLSTAAVEYEAFLPQIPSTPEPQTVPSTIHSRERPSTMTRYGPEQHHQQLSPGEQTVSTVNGRDIFERNRSRISNHHHDKYTIVTPKSSHQQQVTDRETSPVFVSSLAKQSSNSREPPATFTSSLENSRSASPSILGKTHSNMNQSSRERSANNSPSTNGMLEEAEYLINKYSRSEDMTTEVGEHATITNTPVREGEEEATNTNERPPKPSPTSVVQMFDSEYPVELDPVERYNGENSSDADFTQCQRHRAQLQPQPPPLPPRDPPTKVVPGSTSSNLKTLSESTTLASQRALASKILNTSSSQWTAALPGLHHHHSPGNMFDGTCQLIKSNVSQATNWDPLTYTSLEDAVIAHAAMLTTDVPGATSGAGGAGNNAADLAGNKAADVASGLALADCSSSTTTSIASAGIGRMRSSSTTNKKDLGGCSKEFLALKKDAEKNEFKKIVFLKKTNANHNGILSPEDATRMTNMEPQENIELQAMLDAYGNAANSTSADETPPLRPPGSPKSLFLQDSKTPSIPPREATLSLRQHSQQHSTTSDIVVDIIQSFSFDQDSSLGNYEQYNLSDDSCSYLSELESIGDITICDETSRLIEAHKAYTEATNVSMNHPCVKTKKSIMKVGTQFRLPLQSQESVGVRGRVSRLFKGREQQITSSSALNGALLSNKSNVSSEDTIFEIPESKKLTWYDDEINWDKPITLRTDESFDTSTVTTIDNTTVKGGGGVRMGGMEGIVRYNVVDQFFGDFIKGIGKYANCGGEEDVASFDASGQHEI